MNDLDQAVIVVCLVLAGGVIALYLDYSDLTKDPGYTPTEQAAVDWGHEHIGGHVTAVCHAESCMVWATYYSGRSTHTSPPIVLTCEPTCTPDFQRSTAAPGVTP